MPLEEELELASTGVSHPTKKRRSADDQIIEGPDQEWESKALASTDGAPLGRDESGRSRRIASGQVLCQHGLKARDMSDDITVKTSNVRG